MACGFCRGWTYRHSKGLDIQTSSVLRAEDPHSPCYHTHWLLTPLSGDPQVVIGEKLGAYTAHPACNFKKRIMQLTQLPEVLTTANRVSLGSAASSE